MIVGLLILVVLILLFGAAAVKGWIRKGVAGILAFGLFCVIFAELASAFGEGAVMAALVGGGLLLTIAIAFIQSRAKATMFEQERRVARDAGRAARKQNLKRVPKIERLWHHFRADISRFSPEAQRRAHALYLANDVQGLRVFCRAEIEERPVQTQATGLSHAPIRAAGAWAETPAAST